MTIEQKIRKIHVNLPESTHKLLRIECAYKDTSIQEYVTKLIQHSLKKIAKKHKEK